LSIVVMASLGGTGEWLSIVVMASLGGTGEWLSIVVTFSGFFLGSAMFQLP
jgi:hypothetical protein